MRLMLMSVFFVVTGCTTVEEKSCPVCVDTSLSDQEICDLEKAELVKKHEDCLDAYYRSEMKCNKLIEKMRVQSKKKTKDKR